MDKIKVKKVGGIKEYSPGTKVNSPEQSSGHVKKRYLPEAMQGKVYHMLD